MTLSGLIMMLSSYFVVGALMLFCFIKILTNPQSTLKEHAPLDIDTQDKDTPMDQN